MYINTSAKWINVKDQHVSLALSFKPNGLEKNFMNFRQTRFSISRQLCMLVKPCNGSMNLGPTRKDWLY